MDQPPPYDSQYPKPSQPQYPPTAAGDYPPPQGQYPPPQGGYPPPQGGYPPQQGGYPPQQGGYPPQQGGYPPPQGAYPPAGAPPPQTMIIHQPAVVINPVVFSRHPVQMTCPGCHQVVQSRVSYEVGTGTWVIAGIIGLATGCMCCFLACLIDACKDAVHTCPSCNVILGRKDCM